MNGNELEEGERLVVPRGVQPEEGMNNDTWRWSAR